MSNTFVEKQKQFYITTVHYLQNMQSFFMGRTELKKL